MKKLYFSDSQIKDIALFTAGETQSRWQAKPVELLELAEKLRNLAAVAPTAGKITIDTTDANGNGYSWSWQSAEGLLLAAAAKAEKEADERLRSAMSLFRDVIDPTVSEHRNIAFTAEERD